MKIHYLKWLRMNLPMDRLSPAPARARAPARIVYAGLWS